LLTGPRPPPRFFFFFGRLPSAGGYRIPRHSKSGCLFPLRGIFDNPWDRWFLPPNKGGSEFSPCPPRRLRVLIQGHVSLLCLLFSVISPCFLAEYPAPDAIFSPPLFFSLPYALYGKFLSFAHFSPELGGRPVCLFLLPLPFFLCSRMLCGVRAYVCCFRRLCLRIYPCNSLIFQFFSSFLQ